MYSIDWVSGAERDFERIARRAFRDDVDRIQEAIASLADEPRPRGTVKLAGERDAYRIRVGRYRIIYTVEDQTQKVVIVKVARRATAYR